MKQLFYIDHEGTGPREGKLSIQIGENYFAFAVTEERGTSLKQLAYSVKDQRSNEWNETELKELLASHPVLKNSFNKINFSYNSPDAVLFPTDDIMGTEFPAILMDKHPDSEMISEKIMNGELINFYPVPSVVKQFIEEHFARAKFYHPYSLLLNAPDHSPGKEYLLVDFRHEEFTIVALKEARLILAQTISYSVAADVLYYLLKLCHHTGLKQETVILRFSGLLDRQSGLFRELYQYFTNISLRESGWDQLSLYPAHFFTTLNDLATCG